MGVDLDSRPTTGDTWRRDFLAGARVMMPVLLGAMPFALVTGVVAVKLGLSALAACGLSVIVFAGASQLAAVQLIHDGAPVAVILVTVLFINLRFTMYSAAIAPYFRGTSKRLKALLAYLLSDQAYVLSLYGFAGRDARSARVAFYLGAAVTLWSGWQLATLAGVFAGSRLPTDWGLDFAIPLTFMAMLMPSVRDRPGLAAAAVGAIVAVLAHAMPWNLGLIVGALSGIGAGVLAARMAPPDAG